MTRLLVNKWEIRLKKSPSARLDPHLIVQVVNPIASRITIKVINMYQLVQDVNVIIKSFTFLAQLIHSKTSPQEWGNFIQNKKIRNRIYKFMNILQSIHKFIMICCFHKLNRRMQPIFSFMILTLKECGSLWILMIVRYNRAI